jgi:hypothetical protein
MACRRRPSHSRHATVDFAESHSGDWGSITNRWTRVPMYRESPCAKSKELRTEQKDFAPPRQLDRSTA